MQLRWKGRHTEGAGESDDEVEVEEKEGEREKVNGRAGRQA